MDQGFSKFEDALLLWFIAFLLTALVFGIVGDSSDVSMGGIMIFSTFVTLPLMIWLGGRWAEKKEEKEKARKAELKEAMEETDAKSLQEFIDQHPRASDQDKRELESAWNKMVRKEHEEKRKEIKKSIINAVDWPQPSSPWEVLETVSRGIGFAKPTSLLEEALTSVLESKWPTFATEADIELCLYDILRNEHLTVHHLNHQQGEILRRFSIQYYDEDGRPASASEPAPSGEKDVPVEAKKDAISLMEEKGRLDITIQDLTWAAKKDIKLRRIEEVEQQVKEQLSVRDQTDQDALIRAFAFDRRVESTQENVEALQHILFRNGQVLSKEELESRIRRANLDGNQSQHEAPRPTTGASFEKALKSYFEDEGYNVEMTPATNDQGADLLLTGADDRIVVQAKRYQQAVGNKAVQEVIAAREYYDANRAMVVTNSRFTDSAVDLAEQTGVELMDGSDLPV